MACGAGGIKVRRDIRGLFLLTRHRGQAIVDVWSRDASRASALSQKRDTLRRVEVAEPEMDKALKGWSLKEITLCYLLRLSRPLCQLTMQRSRRCDRRQERYKRSMTLYNDK